MEEFRILISPAAQSDLLDIAIHLSNQDPEEEDRYYELITEKVRSLARSPDSFPPARDMQLRLRGYRMLSVEKYIIFFVVKDRTVELRRILYARRQYERLI